MRKRTPSDPYAFPVASNEEFPPHRRFFFAGLGHRKGRWTDLVSSDGRMRKGKMQAYKPVDQMQGLSDQRDHPRLALSKELRNLPFRKN